MSKSKLFEIKMCWSCKLKCLGLDLLSDINKSIDKCVWGIELYGRRFSIIIKDKLRKQD